jgi:hypothetical protein
VKGGRAYEALLEGAFLRDQLLEILSPLLVKGDACGGGVRRGARLCGPVVRRFHCWVCGYLDGVEILLRWCRGISDIAAERVGGGLSSGRHRCAVAETRGSVPVDPFFCRKPISGQKASWSSSNRIFGRCRSQDAQSSRG